MQFESAIPQMLAYIYSSFAALKFISFTIAMHWRLPLLSLG